MEDNTQLILVCLTLLGACIGSFLNVVIYRVPRGISVQKPARSFCPSCGKLIPWYLNIPLLSWLLLRGRSACCHKPISVRYWLVEAGCTLLFFAIGWCFEYEPIYVQVALGLWCACMLALLVIDWEQMVVEPRLALAAGGCGVFVAAFDPCLIENMALRPMDGVIWSLAGAVGGYLIFRMVALGGRWLFGRRVQRFAEPTKWQLRQVGEDIALSVGGQEYLWTEVFLEGYDCIVLEGASVAALPGAEGQLRLEEDALVLPDGTRRSLEEFESLSGACGAVVIRREAMGSGDAWLALGIGALCGWQGVVFALVGGSVLGLIFALIMRVRRGVPMPFGPSLILAAYLWLFCGPQLLSAYLDMLP